MTSVLLFEFDKIFTLILPPPAKSIRDICFRPLPKLQWVPEALVLWEKVKKQGTPAVLVAFENESLVKDAIYGSGFCPYFDHFIFVEELKGARDDPYEVIMGELGRVYGLCKPYSCRPANLPELNPLKLHCG